MDLLNVKNISKSYVNHRALDNISIDIPRASIFGLLGPNGAGKTTLIRIINQIINQDSGQILLHGININYDDIRKIGYMPEERGLYKKMKIGDFLLFMGKLKGLSRSESINSARDWFNNLEVSNWWNKNIEDLSKGMSQKVQFISTVLHNPDLIILDEPFSGFDPVNANLIKKNLLRLKDEGKTIIFSTHRMESVDELCDNLAMIDKSKKILSGKINDIKSAYKSDIYKIKHLNKINDKISNFSVIDSKIVFDNIYESEIKLIKKISSSDLLRLLLSNSIEILEFKQKTPNMNDIFIMKVEEGNNNG
ncbi:MAG: ATP-binding cassette domain-containing protein [Bacteroidota bacterium]|uniref:ABC transporter domain-containing protein n=1 Tax=marine metagenome TaxID=408172 RepID=A0A381QM65_9ZZZZ|nr:ATP-binding cassette domain-containing protein [Bacteroidota bacterium]|tara:strand:- start:1774 stop:2694 length:921 start_codon:yes stop_codon:yes gene_type:complete